MNVLDRLALIVDYDEPVVFWRPRLREFDSRDPMLERISVAGAGFNLGHMYKRLNKDMLRALTFVTPEAEWFRQLTRPTNGSAMTVAHQTNQ